MMFRISSRLFRRSFSIILIEIHIQNLLFTLKPIRANDSHVVATCISKNAFCHKELE